MKTTETHSKLHKRPCNLLLNDENVRQAKHFTSNLSATVDSLLAEFVERERAAQMSKQQLGDAVSEAWNGFRAANGSFADDHSTL